MEYKLSEITPLGKKEKFEPDLFKVGFMFTSGN